MIYYSCQAGGVEAIPTRGQATPATRAIKNSLDVVQLYRVVHKNPACLKIPCLAMKPIGYSRKDPNSILETWQDNFYTPLCVFSLPERENGVLDLLSS